MLNQRQLLSRVALRTIRFTLSDIQCGADKNWHKQKQLGDPHWTSYQAHILKGHIADYQNHSQ